MTRDELLAASPRALAAALAGGRRVDPAGLAGWQFHGYSLGLPRWLERLSWKTFIKVFVRDPDGTVRGWNLRITQPWHDPAAPPFTPRRRRGARFTFGHFVVVDEPRGVMLDYGRGGNRAGDPVGALRDPLVALDDRGDRLLGTSLIAIAGWRVATPSYFLLERGPAVDHVAIAPRGH